MTRRGTESIGQRAAEEAADADGEEVDRRRGARLGDRHAAPRQHHRHERREADRGQRPQHDDQVEQRQRLARTAAAPGTRRRVRVPAAARSAALCAAARASTRERRDHQQRRRAAARSARANGAKTSGASAKPSEPPVMWNDIARPLRCAGVAGGPAPPPADETRRRRDRRATRTAASAQTFGARPTSGSIATPTSGPASSSTRGRQRSARWPKPSCETEFASWKHICSVPAAGQRQVQLRDEQRQQRREDVAVAVDEEVRAGQQQDGRVQAERPDAARHRRASPEPAASRAPRLRGTRGCAAAYAAAASTDQRDADRRAEADDLRRRALSPGSSRGSQPSTATRGERPSAPTRRRCARASRRSRRPRARRGCRRSSTSSSAGVEQRGDRRAERQPALPHHAHEHDVQRRVDEHRDDADDRPACGSARARRTPATRCGRPSSRPGRSRRTAAPRRWPACRPAVNAPRSKMTRTIGVGQHHQADGRRHVQHQHQRQAVGDRRRAPPRSSSCAACRDTAGSVAVAIETPNSPIGRYISRKA